jgi:hypothetical protein
VTMINSIGVPMRICNKARTRDRVERCRYTTDTLHVVNKHVDLVEISGVEST